MYEGNVFVDFGVEFQAMTAVEMKVYPELDDLKKFIYAIEQQNNRLLSMNGDDKPLVFFKELEDSYCELFDFVETNANALRSCSRSNIAIPDLSAFQASRDILTPMISKEARAALISKEACGAKDPRSRSKTEFLNDLINTIERIEQVIRSLLHKTSPITIAIFILGILVVIALIIAFTLSR
jgi:hypothetical protein